MLCVFNSNTNIHYSLKNIECKYNFIIMIGFKISGRYLVVIINPVIFFYSSSPTVYET